MSTGKKNPQLLTVKLIIFAGIALLASCTGTGLKQQPASLIVAKPQIIYQIDKFRYFLLESREEDECYSGIIVYIDEKLKIRATVESFGLANLWPRKFTIDAFNTQYLGAPTQRSSGNCTSGGGDCYGSATHYSIDYGRSWISRRQGGNTNILISDSKFYEYELSVINNDQHGRGDGEYFDMKKPDEISPYNWIPYENPGTDWTLADYGMTTIPVRPSTAEKQALAKYAVFSVSSAEKIKMAPLPLIPPFENSFHCVRKPIINNE